MKTRTLVLVGWVVVGLAVLTVVLMNGGKVTQAQRGSDNRVVLANGITVLMYPVPGAEKVALVYFHPVGFLHEPKGMIQAAHLLEHLACQGATKSYQAGEAMRLLNQEGMANAETLSDFTYFDHVLPPGQLEPALQIAAERLSSLRIVPEIIRQEAPKCHQEADIVERNPSAGMLKHAFMAFGQAWRHGAREVQVREGLERIPVADLERFYRASYNPQGVVVVLAGAFERAKALELVEKHLGSIKPTGAAAPQPLPWSQVPEEMTVQWDSSVRAVCIGFPPPDDVKERFLLNLWGNLLFQRLMTDTHIQAAADAMYCTNSTWGVGTLPFFVYATAKANVSAEQLQRLLAARVRSITAAKPGLTEMMQFRAMASQFAHPPEFNEGFIRQQGQALASQLGRNPDEAAAMVMGNMAIQAGLRELLLGTDSAQVAKALQAVTADDLHRLLRRTLDPSRGFVTVLMPMGQAR
ncbi:MAG: insulinase family protein [Armatimonadota bacterium]|nr:MAG: insulinase family protein [Armatimonadota bacterium]